MRYPQLPPEKSHQKNKKPAGAICASGPMSALCNETLSTPNRTRPVAGMMVVPMRLTFHAKIERKENLAWCQSEDFYRGRKIASAFLKMRVRSAC
jgi:hypothetical protein